ncbi:MAG: hypothetical protein AAGB05_02860 [Pseudomonadota bacterium]
MASPPQKPKPFRWQQIYGMGAAKQSEEKGRGRVQILKLKEASAKALIVLIPTYSMAYFTEKMVWVVPTLAAAGFFAGTISFAQEESTTRRLEDDIDVDSEALDEDGPDGSDG